MEVRKAVERRGYHIIPDNRLTDGEQNLNYVFVCFDLNISREEMGRQRKAETIP